MEYIQNSNIYKFRKGIGKKNDSKCIISGVDSTQCEYAHIIPSRSVPMYAWVPTPKNIGPSNHFDTFSGIHLPAWVAELNCGWWQCVALPRLRPVRIYMMHLVFAPSHHHYFGTYGNRYVITVCILFYSAACALSTLITFGALDFLKRRPEWHSVMDSVDTCTVYYRLCKSCIAPWC